MGIQIKIWKHIILTALFILLSLPSFSFAEESDTTKSQSTVAESSEDSSLEEESSETILSDEISATSESSLESEESELQEEAKTTDEAALVEAQSTTMSMTSGIGGGTSDSGNGVYSTTEAVSSLYTGAATYRVPIVVPPGRNGIQPNLSLAYNSYSGNGWIGEGWSLDLGAIQRSTKHGVDYSADDYVAGGSELVPRSDWGDNYYGAKIEGAFSKYYYNSTTGGWEVTSTAGTKYYYGTDSASRQTNTDGTFKWCLDKVLDTNGNYMTITYVTDNGHIYPSRIDYTGNSGLSTTKYIEFTLEDRDDVQISYKSMSEVITSKRLSKISTYTDADEDPVREYVLTHETNTINGRSRLTQININGSDGQNTMNPITFGWMDGGDGTFDISSTTYINDISGSIQFGDIDGDGHSDFIKHFAFFVNDLSKYKVYVLPFLSNGDGTFTGLGLVELAESDAVSVSMGDVDGNGFDDIVSIGTGGNVYSYLSDGTGNFSDAGASAGSATTDATFLADLNGDGFSDLIRHDADTGTVYTCLSSGSGTFETCGSGHTGEGGAGEGLVTLSDINNDGYPDLIKLTSTGTAYVYLADGAGAFSGTGIPKVISNFENSKYIRFADINGDGLADLINNVSSGIVYVYLSIGAGSFGEQITAISSGFSSDMALGDINGDGLTDIVQVDESGDNYTYLSYGDGTFSDYIYAGGPEGTGTVYLADVDGDGKSDIIKKSSGDYANCVCTSLAQGDGPADHIQTIENELGGTTTLTYTKSSEYPENYIPFIMYPLSQITSDDNNSVISETTFTYSGPYYDYPEREFRGFEYVKQTNPDGTTEETWYHPDQDDDYMKGLIVDIQAKTPGGTLLSKKTFTWDTYPEVPETYAFVKLTARQSNTYDVETVTINDTYTYYDDTNGKLHTSITSSSTSPGETITSTYVYENIDTWLWRLSQETFEGSSSGNLRETYYSYDANGNMLSKEFMNSSGTNPVVDMGYDNYGNMTSITDAEDNTTTIDYDSATETYPVAITNAAGHTAEVEYDECYGKAILSVDQNGNETEYAYDRYGRMIQADYPNGGQVIYTYYDTASPVYVLTQVKEDSSSYIDSYTYYDGFGRAIQSKSFGVSNPIVSRAYYDTMGRIYRTEGPYFADASGDPLSTEFSYGEITFDWFNRPVVVEGPNSSGGVSQVEYDYSGLSTTVTDPDGNQKTYIKDYLGRIIEVQEDSSGGTTYYTYNAAGDLTQVEDADGNITTINYDTLGRKINMDDPDMGYWQYTYDANGNLLTQTDAKNQTITFGYDELNRVISKTYSTSDPTVTFTYDNQSIENGIGLLYSVTNGYVTTVINGYDEMGRVTSLSKTISGTSRTTAFEYDLSGKATKTTYHGGYYVTNEYYPGTNLLHTVTGSDSEVYATISDYEPTGKMGTIIHGNGTSTTYSYDDRATRLTGILTKDSDNNNIQERSYAYSSAGDIESIYDDVDDITYTYTYDDLHRLKTETNDGGYGAMSINYDELGNITSKTIGSTTMSYAYNNTDHIHAVSAINGYSFSYDDNGNMTQGWDFTDISDIKQRDFEWNADNMPVEINYEDGEAVTTLLYDGTGSRARKKVVSGGATTYTYYFGDHYEIKGGVTYKYIFAGNLRVAQIEGSSVSYFHKDHLGSSTLMTDASGAQIESTNYQPFGGVRDHTGTDTSNYDFTDQELDAENGLYNYGARLYDPIIGRFISPDTIVSAPYNPQSLNRYSYCLNNPLIYIDPSGHGGYYEGDLLGGDLTWVEDKDDTSSSIYITLNNPGQVTQWNLLFAQMVDIYLNYRDLYNDMLDSLTGKSTASEPKTNTGDTNTAYSDPATNTDDTNTGYSDPATPLPDAGSPTDEGQTTETTSKDINTIDAIVAITLRDDLINSIVKSFPKSETFIRGASTYLNEGELLQITKSIAARESARTAAATTVSRATAVTGSFIIGYEIGTLINDELLINDEYIRSYWGNNFYDWLH